MPALPDRAVLRAVADVVITEEKARAAADRELAGDLLRLRERIDEYGNVIETRFLGLEHRMREQIATTVASLGLKDGAPGERGEDGQDGPAGPPGEPGEVGAAGDPGYPGRACGLYSAAAAYRAMDVVAFNGSEWRAVADDPGPLPGAGWMLGAKGVKGEKGERGGRGEAGDRGPPGPAGVGISDIVIDAGVLVIMLTDGSRREFVMEAA